MHQVTPLTQVTPVTQVTLVTQVTPLTQVTPVTQVNPVTQVTPPTQNLKITKISPSIAAAGLLGPDLVLRKGLENVRRSCSKKTHLIS